MNRLVIILLVASLVLTNQDICTSVFSLSTISRTPDGIIGKEFQKVDYLEGRCKDGSTQFEYDSKWVETKDIQIGFYADTLQVQSSFIRRIITANLSPSGLEFNMRIFINVTLSGSIAGITLTSTTLHWTLKRDVTLRDVNALDHTTQQWKGSMVSTSKDSIVFKDYNSFDGVDPVIYNISTSEPFDQYWDRISKFSRNTLRFMSSDTSTITIPIPIRSVFSHKLEKETLVNTERTDCQILTKSGAFSSNGQLFTSDFECNSAECSKNVIIAMQEVLAQVSQEKCSALSLMDETLSVRLFMEAFISQQTTLIRSIQTESSGLFKCDNKGYIGIRISGTVTGYPNDEWDTSLLNSNITIRNLFKSLTYSMQGNLLARIEHDGEIYTSLSNDLFSDRPSGFLIRNFDFPNDEFAHNLSTKLIPHLLNQVSFHDMKVIDEFSPSKVNSIIKEYKQQQWNPDLLSFITFFGNRLGFKVLVQDNGNTIYLYREKSLSGSFIELNDIAFTRINSALLPLGIQITNPNEIETSRVRVISKASIKIENLVDIDNLVITSIQPLQWMANLYMQAPALNVTALYSYSDDRVSVTYNDLTWSSGGSVIRDYNINHEIFFKQMKGIIEDDSKSLWLLSEVPLVNQNVAMFTSSLLWTDIFLQLIDKLNNESPKTFIAFKNVVERFLNTYCDDFNCDTVSLAIVTPNSDNSITFEWKYSRVITLRLTSPIGTTLSRISRTQLDTLSITSMKAKLYVSEPTFEYSIRAKEKYQGFVLPISVNMEQVINPSSIWSIDFDIPNYAKLDLVAELLAETPQKLIVTAENLLSRSAYFSQHIEGLEEHKYLTTHEIMNENKERILKAVMFASSQMISPSLGSPIEMTKHLFEYLENAFEWFLTSHHQHSQIFTLDIPNGIGIPSLEFTINEEIEMSCPIPVLSGSLKENTEIINNALNACGVGNLLIAQEPDDESSSSYGIYSKLTRSSWLLRISVNGTRSDGLPVLTGFGNQQATIFETFQDLYWLMHEITGLPRKPIQTVQVNPLELGLDENISKYFENQIAKVYPIQFSLEKLIDNIPLTTFLDAQNGTFQFNFGNQSMANNVAFSVFVDYSIGNAWFPGFSNASISTNANETTTIWMPITNQGDFIIEVQLEKRNKTHVTKLLDHIHYIAPIGSRIADIPSNINIPEYLIENLVVYVQNGSRELQTLDQVVFDLVRSIHDEEVILPISIKIIHSTIPGINITTDTPSSSITFMKGYTSKIEYKYEPQSNDITSKMSSFDLKTPEVHGTAWIQAKQIQKKEFMDLDLLNPYVPESMIQHFDLILISNTTLVFDDTQVQADNYDLEPVTMKWNSYHNIYVETPEDLEEIQHQKPNGKIEFESKNEDVIETMKHLSEVKKQDWCDVLDQIRDKMINLLEQPMMNAKIPFLQTKFGNLFSKTIKERLENTRTGVCEQIIEFHIVKLCKLLEEQFGQQICFNLAVGVRNFSVTLRLEKLLYNFNDKLEISEGLFNGKLPMLGYESSVIVHTGSVLEMTLFASWQSGKLDFRILDGAFFSTSIKVKMDGAINLQVGALPIGMVGAQVYIGHPEEITWKATMFRGKPIQLDVTGEALFSGHLKCFGKDVCSYSAQISDVKKFIENPKTGLVVDQRTCKHGSLGLHLEDLLKDNSIGKFLSNPGLVINSWITAFKSFRTRVLTETGVKKLQSIAMPVIQFAAYKLLEKQLNAFTEGKFSNELRQELNEIARGIVYQDDEHRDHWALKAFTRFLCEKLPLEECPPVPDYPQERYEWKLPFLKTYTKQIVSLEFPLKGKSKAKLSAECNLVLQLDLRFKIRLVFSKVKGISFEFDNERILEAKFSLPMDQCRLSGYFGFLGAALQTKPGSGVYASIFVLNDNNNWSVDYEYKGDLKAEAVLGLAGKVRDDLEGKQDPLKLYLHFTADLEIQFYHELDREIRPKLKFGNVKFCLGQYLARFAGGFMKQANKITQHLSRFLGINGVLMQRVRLPIGRDMTVAEMIVLWARTEGKNVKGVEKMLQVMQILQAIEQLNHKLEIINRFITDESLCSVWIKGQSFNYDTETGEIDKIGTPPSDELQTDGFLKPDEWEHFKDSYFSMQKTQGFKIEFPITSRSIPEIIINALMGIPMDLVKLSLPGFEISAQKYWSVPVYCCPLVELFLQFHVQFAINTPSILLTSEAFYAVIETRKVQSILRGLYLDSRNPDGTSRPVISGAVTLTGGVSVTLIVLEGSVYVDLRFAAQVHLVSILDAEPRIRFDMIRKLPKQVALEVVFTFGAGFHLRFCIKIKLLFVKIHKCWTIVHWKVGPWVIWKDRWGPPVIKRPITGGNVDLSSLNGGGIVTLNEDYVCLSDPKEEAPLSAPKKSGPVTLVSNPSGPTLVEAFSNSVINIPGSSQISVNYEMNLNNHKSILIQSNSITTDSGLGGIKTTGNVKSVSMNMPVVGDKIILEGSPAEQLYLDASHTNVEFKMNPEVFSTKRIVINEGNILVKQSSTLYHITSESVLANNIKLFEYINSPEITIVTPDNENSIVNVVSVQPATTVNILGGNGEHIVNIENIFSGIQDINVNTGPDLDQVNIKVPVESNSILKYIISSNMIYAESSNNQRSVTTTDVEIRRQEFTLSENSHLELGVQLSGEIEEIYIDTITHSTATVYSNFSECIPGNNIHYNKFGEGSEIVYLSSSGKIRTLHCHIYLTGKAANNENFSVVIDASRDVPLNFEIIGTRIEVTDPTDTDYRMVVHLTNVPTVRVLMPTTNKSFMMVKDSAQNVDYYIDYPDQLLNGQDVVFCKTAYSSNFAIRGMVNVQITPYWYQCTGEQSKHALEYIRGTIAVLGSNNNNEVVPVVIDSGLDYDVEFFVNASCVIPTVDREPAKYLIPWNNRMKQYLSEFGITESSLCEFVYASKKINLTIVARNGKDLFRGYNVDVNNLDVDLGDGRAWIEWNESLSPATFKTGKHMTRFMSVSPSGPMNVLLGGSYGEDNAIIVYSKYFYPETKADGEYIILDPLGPCSSCKGKFKTRKHDSFTIIHGNV